jgi:hypothetical protein
LIVDNVSILDQTADAPQTTALPLGLDYERTNISDLAQIRQDLTAQIIIASAFHLSPQSILDLRQILMGSATGAASLTKNTLQTGVNVTEKTTQKAGEKISSGLKSLKNKITNHGQTIN